MTLNQPPNSEDPNNNQSTSGSHEAPLLTVETAIETASRSLRARQAAVRETHGRIVAAADAYLRAKEADVSADLLASIGAAPKNGSASRVVQAALGLRALVDALPEVRIQSLSQAPPAQLVVTDQPQRAARVLGADPEGDALLDELKAANFDAMSDQEFRWFAEELACRARGVEERLGARGDAAPETRVINILNARRCSRGMTGIFGLARHHQAAWADRAKRAHSERECVARRAAQRSTPQCGPPKEPSAEAAPEEEEERPVPLPALVAASRGGAIVIYGGLAQAPKLDRLRRRTGIELEWIGADDGRSLSARIRAGHVAALVLLDGFIHHANGTPVTDAARKASLVFEFGKRAGTASILNALVKIDERLGATAGAA